MFNFGEFKAEDQEQMLTALNKKVGEVYRNCIGENEANITLASPSDSLCSMLVFFQYQNFTHADKH